MKTGFKQAPLAFLDRRLDSVFDEANLVPAHVVLNVDAQKFAAKSGIKSNSVSMEKEHFETEV
jgi:hypothetical protein